MYDGRPTCCVEDASFACVGAHSAHVGVGFQEGASLDDSADLPEGRRRRMRHVKTRRPNDVDAHMLRALIRAAYSDMHVRPDDAERAEPK